MFSPSAAIGGHVVSDSGYRTHGTAYQKVTVGRRITTDGGKSVLAVHNWYERYIDSEKKQTYNVR